MNTLGSVCIYESPDERFSLYRTLGSSFFGLDAETSQTLLCGEKCASGVHVIERFKKIVATVLESESKLLKVEYAQMPNFGQF